MAQREPIRLNNDAFPSRHSRRAIIKCCSALGLSLAGIAERAATRMEGYDAEAYIEHSILSPKDYLVEGFPDTMPTNFGRELTSDELSSVVAYLMTLK